jgi:hypothetical protein
MLMDSTLATRRLSPPYGRAPSVAAGSEARELDRPTVRTGVLVSALFWGALGCSLFFALYALPFGESPGASFSAAFLAGAVGIAVATLSLRKEPRYRLFLFCIVSAYLLRTVVGVVCYVGANDPDYFDGKGSYQNKNWEFRWTYVNAVAAADSVTKKGEWRPEKIFDGKLDKNPYLHAWMGYFLAAGPARNALDLTPFNAFHHAIAGVFIACIALSCGYSPGVALLAGALTAWIPWAFPASNMWRDSVGFAGVVLSVLVLCLGRNLGFLATLLAAVPAGFLAWADRSAYLMVTVLLACLSILFEQQKSMDSGAWKLVRLLLVAALLGTGAYYLSHHIGEIAFARHESHTTGNYLSGRILLVPLLALRALAGPFPWSLGNGPSVMFDYAFHVLQFAVFLVMVGKWRSLPGNLNLLSYAAGLYWVVSFLAGGVHTAYVAVAFPFLLPAVLSTGVSLGKPLLASLACFAVANVVYIALGLAGSGLVLGVTGY